jgi:DNA replication protein DnaC
MTFDVAASSIQRKCCEHLSKLIWLRMQQNRAVVIGPAGSGKSHTLIGLGTRRLFGVDLIIIDVQSYRVKDAQHREEDRQQTEESPRRR